MSSHDGYLLLVDCSPSSNIASPYDAAFQLGAELLRWPEDVMCAMENHSIPTLPNLLVRNKYFSAMVHLITAHAHTLWSQSPSHSSPNGATDAVLRQCATATGCVLLITDADATPVDTIPWHCVPMVCLFRVVVLFGASAAGEAVWYDACVANGFELVLHNVGFEIIPHAVECCGLLSGDLRGAARVLQILHNTVWPTSGRTLHHGETPKCESNSSPPTHTSTKGINEGGWDGVGMENNLLALVGIGGAAPLRWLTKTATDRRFFTARWPIDLHATETKPDERWSIALANRYYTAVLETIHVHPALLHPTMVDLFLAQYEDRRAQLAVVCWPPTFVPLRQSGNTTPGTTDARSYPPLPVLMDHLSRWGVKECVLLVQERKSLSRFERHYCREHHVEVILSTVKKDHYTSNDAITEEEDEDEGKDEVGTTGADRLAEVIHMSTWPQLTLVPSSAGNFARPEGNRLLLWACASSLQEEEMLLQRCLADHLAATTSRKMSALSVTSTIVDGSPVMQVHFENKYFEAHVDVHCVGGACSSITRARIPTLEQLGAFDAIILVTTANACRSTETSRLTEIIAQCCLAHAADSKVPVVLGIECVRHGVHEVNGESDTLRKLCEEATSTAALLFYVIDGKESDEKLGLCVNQILSKAASKEKNGECNGNQSSMDGKSFQEEEEEEEEECADELDTSFSPPPFDVIYSDDAARVREAMEQHMWPKRKMHNVENGTTSHHSTGSNNKNTNLTSSCSNSHKKSNNSGLHNAVNDSRPTNAVVEEVNGEPLVGCTLPPDYLIDPITLRSQHVSALVTPPSASVAMELKTWTDAMRRYGDRLPRLIRQQQAERLAIRLGECLSATDDDTMDEIQ